MSFILRAGTLPVNPHTLRHFQKESGWLYDSAAWEHDLATARAKAQAMCMDVSMIIQAPLFFLDIDDCLINGQWSPLAQALVARFPGAYVEISRSGEGLHVIGTLAAPIEHGCKNNALGIELYTSGRAAALTFTGARGDWASVHDLGPTVAEFFPPLARDEGVGWTDEAAPGYIGPSDDADLLLKARGARSAAAAFGGGVTFADLWDARADVLATAYPPKNAASAYDHSGADGALAMHLAFWTGRDCERMRRLMWQSGLVREKWTVHESYLARTIHSACQRSAAYPGSDRAADPLAAVRPAGVTMSASAIGPAQFVVGLQYLSADLQAEYFAGFCYVAKDDRIYTPSGEAYKRAVFDSMFGGFVFQLDDTNRKTTKSAWEAFTQSQVLRHAKTANHCYKPGGPPRAIIDGAFNTYAGGCGERVGGDVSPFLTHCEKLLPDEGDRAVLLSWMAACVQHPGVKFTWAPFVQGTEGNGKSLFISVMEYCLGERNTFLPRADEIAEKFNSWLFTHQFIGVHDLYIPHERLSLWETVKPMISERRQPRRGMASEWESGHVCANFMLNSNYQSAVPRTDNDRRAAPLFTAQQSREHLARDGMTGAYFPQLISWMYERGGLAIIADYLANYAIPDELNPATLCIRAPMTTSHGASLAACKTPAEQAIEEAIAECRVGFRGGYVSSWALSQLLDGLRLRCSPTKKTEILTALGYDKGGRLPAASHIDGGTRPYVYIKNGVLSEYLNTQLTEV